MTQPRRHVQSGEGSSSRIGTASPSPEASSSEDSSDNEFVMVYDFPIDLSQSLPLALPPISLKHDPESPMHSSSKYTDESEVSCLLSEPGTMSRMFASGSALNGHEGQRRAVAGSQPPSGPHIPRVPRYESAQSPAHSHQTSVPERKPHHATSGRSQALHSERITAITAVGSPARPSISQIRALADDSGKPYPGARRRLNAGQLTGTALDFGHLTEIRETLDARREALLDKFRLPKSKTTRR